MVFVPVGSCSQPTDQLSPVPDAGLVQNFEIIFLPGDEREPAGLLGRLQIPLARRSSVVSGRGRIVGRRDPGAQNFVDRFAVVGNPKLRRVAARDPEIIIARGRRGEIAADALAVIVAVIRDAFERAERVGDGRRRADRNVG